MDIGHRIAAWRSYRRLTQADLARLIGITPAAVYQWEGSGESKTQPKLVHVESVASALGLTMTRFWGPLPSNRKIRK